MKKIPSHVKSSTRQFAGNLPHGRPSLFSLLPAAIASDGTGNSDNKVPDVSSLDVYGNALACTCANGYIVETTSCSDGALESGACSGTVALLTLRWTILFTTIRVRCAGCVT